MYHPCGYLIGCCRVVIVVVVVLVAIATARGDDDVGVRCRWWWWRLHCPCACAWYSFVRCWCEGSCHDHFFEPHTWHMALRRTLLFLTKVIKDDINNRS